MTVPAPILIALTLGLALFTTGRSVAQDPPAAEPETARMLDQAEVEARLAEFRQEVGLEMVPDRIRRVGDKRVQRWLDSFRVVQSRHYLVFTNGPPTSTKRFADQLEKLYAFVKACWPFDDIDHKLSAYIFDEQSEYYDFCTKHAGWELDRAKRTAGHACAEYYAAYYQSPKDETVMHEATHQIVHACLKAPGVGSWIQEGTAEYIAKRFCGSRIAPDMRADLKRGDFYDLHDLIHIRSMLDDPAGHGSRNYAQCASLVEFLMETDDPRMKGKFTELLKLAVGKGNHDPRIVEPMFLKVYGMTTAEVQQAFFAFHGLKSAGPKQRLDS